MKHGLPTIFGSYYQPSHKEYMLQIPNIPNKGSLYQPSHGECMLQITNAPNKYQPSHDEYTIYVATITWLVHAIDYCMFV